MNENGKLQLRYADDGIFLVVANSEYPEMERGDLIRVSLVVDNKTVSKPIISEGGSCLSCERGRVWFRFDDGDALHISGEGKIWLRFELHKLRQFENGCPREDGSIEAAFIMLGKLLFVPRKGALHHNAMWKPEKAQAEDFEITLLPSAESGVFECDVHWYFSNGVA
jgi:hypothetical protein